MGKTKDIIYDPSIQPPLIQSNRLYIVEDPEGGLQKIKVKEVTRHTIYYKPMDGRQMPYRRIYAYTFASIYKVIECL